jgi:hypothetical protein
MTKSTGRRFRPGLELLEAREVPASFTAATVPELIAAIDAANLTPEADDITLAAGKTFTLTAANNNTQGPTGLPVIAAGEDLTIIGNDATIERSSLKGTSPFRLFDVAADATLTLHGMTLQGGRAHGPGAEARGGAIHNLGQLTLDGVTVAKNVAEGLHATRLGWSAGGSAFGGGVYSDGTLVVVNSRIQSNIAVGGDGVDAWTPTSAIGAPVYTYSATRGGAALGGGIYIAGGTATISATTITSNTARGGGGGDGIMGVAYLQGPTLFPPAAGGNSLGGGLYVAGAVASLNTVTITSNGVTGGSGGAGVKGSPDGANGLGMGGGLCIAPEADVALDAFTLTHAKRNHASTADDNISGL